MHEIQHQWSEELTLPAGPAAARGSRPVSCSADDDRQPTSIRPRRPAPREPPRPRGSASRLGRRLRLRRRSRSRARVSATAGLRYTHERKTIDNAGSLTPSTRRQIPLPGSCYALLGRRSRTTPGRRSVGLELAASGERTLAYVSATRGFKSGGFNISSPEAGRGYAPEWAWSYEAGWKTTPGRRPRRARSRGVSHRLRGPPGADVDPPRRAATSRTPPRRDDPRSRAGSVRAIVPGLRFGRTRWPGSTPRYDRYLAGWRRRGHGRRRRQPAQQRARVVGAPCGSSGAEARASSGTLSLRAASRWQSTVFFTPFNDARPAPEPVWSAGR